MTQARAEIVRKALEARKADQDQAREMARKVADTGKVERVSVVRGTLGRRA